MGVAAQTRFVAVATNPAIDRVALLDGPAAGVAPASASIESAGGKAIHAASIAGQLGAASAVVTTAGGSNGRLLVDHLTSEPLDADIVEVAAATRGTYTLVSATEGDLVEVHEPGGRLSADECDRLVSSLAGVGASPRVVAVCGSLPPGAPPDLHARLICVGGALGAYTILDCSNTAALENALGACPDLVAPNLAEAGRLLGVELAPECSDAELIAATDEMRQRGAAAVWLSLGAGGSVLATAEGSHRLRAPVAERVVNAVGCGDALIGGLGAGLVAGLDLASAAALGVAAASVKLGELHPCRVDRRAVAALAPRIDVSRISQEVSVA